MQAYNEAGVAFEPFHLRKERQEGCFDAEGNYVLFKLDEVKDAWLDSLKAGLAVPLYALQLHAPCVHMCITIITEQAARRY